MGSNEKIILQTLLYSDIFDYPLTKEELWLYLHTSNPISVIAFEKVLRECTSITSYKNYFFVKGRKALVKKRLSLLAQNRQKIQIGRKAASFLAMLPSIELIALSGSVAMQSAKETDDIDFFIITKPQTLWLTRLAVFLFLHITQWGRKRRTSVAKNKICVNMIMDENHLTFAKPRRTIYTAHEIIQMKVLFTRGKVFDRFLFSNRWGEKYLYNGFHRPVEQYEDTHRNFFLWFEKIAKSFQIWYMRNHRTREEVKEGFVAFHPVPYEDLIMKKYQEKRKEYGV